MNRTREWYDVAPLEPDDYRLTETVNGIPNSVFVLTGADESLVVDSGFGVGALRDTIDGLVDGEQRLLLTHTHWDHIGCGHAFDTAVVNPVERDGTEVRIDSLSDDFVGRLGTFLAEHREAGGALPDGVDPDSATIPPITGVGAVEPGDVIDLGDRPLELVDLAGHLGVLDREAGVLCGGDVVHVDRSLYLHFEGCDIEAYLDTFDRVIALRDAGAFDTLRTAHNAALSGDELDLLDDLRAALRSIRDGERTPETVETAWGERHRYVIDGTEILTQTDM